MPLDSQHPEYTDQKENFTDCRNAFIGGRAIKKARNRYLPFLKDQTGPDYNAYLQRALFFSITAKTVSALVGLVMMRTPIIKHGPEMDSYFKDNQGAQFMELCSTTIQEVLLMGGYGLYIDAPISGGKPVLARYARESIINWRTDEDGRLLMVMLTEQVDSPKSSDEYEIEKVTQYRKLWLDSLGYYNVTVYDDKKKQLKSFIPTVRGKMLTEIPFYLINTLGVSMSVVQPPMLDIVDLNLSHYRTSADLEHGRHFTGLPTPIVSGVASGGDPLYIGSQTAWILPDASAKAYYLEFTGQGLQSLEKAMVEKQSQMASMSARLIDNSKRGSEAAETVKLRYMSETASLITTVRSVEEGLNVVYAKVAEFLGEPAPIIQLNKEFMEGKLSATDLTAIVKAYLEGAISKDALIYNLRKGDVIPRTEDDDAARRAVKEPGTDATDATDVTE